MSGIGLGVAFTYAMPSGIPGAVNRMGGRMADIEAQIQDATSPVTLYGLFGQIDATSQDFRALQAGDTAAYGLAVRPFPLQATTASSFSGASGLGAAVPPLFPGPIDVLKSGYVTVALKGATAAVKGGRVWTRISGVVAGEPPGSVYAADGGGGNFIELPVGTYFMGPADTNGNVEIAVGVSNM